MNSRRSSEKQLGSSEYYKPLAIVDKAELQNLRDKKIELEQRLNSMQEKENMILSSPQKMQSNIDMDQRIIEQRSTPQKKQTTGTSVAELRRQQQIEKEKEQLNYKIEQAEREKRAQQIQFDRIKEDIRQENMSLKEQSIKNKALQQSSHTQVQDLETQKGQLVRDLKKQKNENVTLNAQIQQLIKRANEFEVQVKQSLSIQLERDDRIKYMQRLLNEEENKHKYTIINSEKLQNTINNLENQMLSVIKDRERLSFEIEEISIKHNERYNEIHDVRLKERRQTNDLQMTQSEFQRVIRDQGEHIRQLELERERYLCRLEDLDRTQERLRQRDRQLIELEVEMEHLHRSKGNVVVERMIKEAPMTTPQIIYQSPTSSVRRSSPPQSEDLIELRRQLLNMSTDRERQLQETNYWKQRFESVETAGDRAVDLLAHQNMDNYSISQQSIASQNKAYTRLKNIVMSFINDLNVGIRRNQVKGVQAVMQRHPELSSILSQKK